MPKMTVVTRKAYGGAYLAMSCKNLRSDVNLAWPSGELAVMGAEGAVRIIHRRDLAESEDPEATFSQLVEEYKAKFGDPYTAARHGWVDDVIEPRETRKRLIMGLRPLEGKRGGNDPEEAWEHPPVTEAPSSFEFMDAYRLARGLSEVYDDPGPLARGGG